MIFAVPIVGKVVASVAASAASAQATATQKASELKQQVGDVGASAPSAFTQALNALDHPGASKGSVAQS